MMPVKSRGDAIQSTSAGTTVKEIRHFKYSPYISYGETIQLDGFEVKLTNQCLKSDKCEANDCL